MTHEAHSRVYREGEGKKGRPQRNSRKKNVGSKNETRQKSHHARCASDGPQDPNTIALVLITVAKENTLNRLSSQFGAFSRGKKDISHTSKHTKGGVVRRATRDTP